MIDIIVIRDAGDQAGDDVVDPMITSVAVAIDRGRGEINEASGTRPIRLRTVYRDGVGMGSVIEVHDALQGRIWRGKISGISHTSSGATMYTNLTISRPRD